MLKRPDIVTSSCRHGEMAHYSRDRFIGRGLALYGEYSPGETALFARILKPGHTVVEVGANIGALTLPLAHIVGPNGRVLAFEPQPENFQLLRANCDQVRPVVKCYDIAVSDVAGEAHIPRLAELGHDNLGDVVLGKGSSVVPTRPLDDIKLGRVDLIKVDVQGMEAQVIRSARRTIAANRPLLYVENDQPIKSEELLQLITSLGYLTYWHKPPIFDEPNFRGAALEAGDRGIVSLNVLCIPEERAADYAAVTGELELIGPARPGHDKWACITRMGGIGDNLVAASVLRPLKAQGYKIEVITQEPQHVVFENSPFIDKLTVRKQGDLPADFKAWGEHFRLRASEYAKFVNLSHSMEGLLAMFDGSMAWDWPAEFRRKMCGHSYLETAHDIVGVPHQFGPLFFPTGFEQAKAAETLRKVAGEDARKVVAWCLAGSRLDKLYPQTPLAIARLIKELDVAVIMFGAPGRVDFEMAKTVQEHVRHVNSTDANLHLALSPEGTDSWPIRRALATAMACDLVIAPDTGMAWGVAMEKVAKIVLHSHASQANITKHWVNTVSMIPASTVKCWPCHKLHNVKTSCEAEQRACGMNVDADAKGAACISSIAVDDIISAARQRLGALP